MKICVTGGAGFIGVHTAHYFASRGDDVVVFDNLSRLGTQSNLDWLTGQHENVSFVRGDVASAEDLTKMAEVHGDMDAVIHLAGQVAVTTSVVNPRDDFQANALGTFNVLEMARAMPNPPIVIYASTNKVYGGMEQVRVVEAETRYRYQDYDHGIPETITLDFHSPYGCSKGAADQYVRDYARIYGMKTVVFRQSCIYGSRQFGIEDQGWVAWFIIAATLGRPITIYGNGKQVRDLLYIDDLTEAYGTAIDNIDQVSGRIYNVGGGPAYSLSLLEMLETLEEQLGAPIAYSFGDWRPGDQPVYISDIRKAKDEMGWAPKVSPREGIAKLVEWVRENSDVIIDALGL